MTETRPVALVTGASSGIGAATARALLSAGFTVVGTNRQGTGPPDLDRVTFVSLDVVDDESVSTAVRQVIDRFGRVDVLVNNAGIGSSGAAEETSVAQAQKVFDINVFGLIRMARAVLPHMRAQGRGRVINISSVYGLMPAPYMGVYAASKHAVEGYSESLDHEIREHGVRSILIEPAFTRTRFEQNLVKPDAPLPVYAKQRAVADRLVAEAVNDGEDPTVVARAVVAAATDKQPKLRYPAGSQAGRVSTLRRLVPPSTFDKQIRKLNHLPH